MDRYSKEFTYDKAFVLNILYDTLDCLSLKIDKANSVHGTLLVSSEPINKVKMKILLSPNLNDTKTVVQIIPGDSRDGSEELVQSIYDEMNSVLVRAGVTQAV